MWLIHDFSKDRMGTIAIERVNILVDTCEEARIAQVSLTSLAEGPIVRIRIPCAARNEIWGKKHKAQVPITVPTSIIHTCKFNFYCYEK